MGAIENGSYVLSTVGDKMVHGPVNTRSPSSRSWTPKTRPRRSSRRPRRPQAHARHRRNATVPKHSWSRRREAKIPFPPGTATPHDDPHSRGQGRVQHDRLQAPDEEAPPEPKHRSVERPRPSDVVLAESRIGLRWLWSRPCLPAIIGTSLLIAAGSARGTCRAGRPARRRWGSP